MDRPNVVAQPANDLTGRCAPLRFTQACGTTRNGVQRRSKGACPLWRRRASGLRALVWFRPCMSRAPAARRDDRKFDIFRPSTGNRHAPTSAVAFWSCQKREGKSKIRSDCRGNWLGFFIIYQKSVYFASASKTLGSNTGNTRNVPFRGKAKS